MPADGECWRATVGGIVLSVRLTPKASREAVDGVKRLADGQAVAVVRVRPPPDKGAANTALLALLARTFAVPKSAVSLVSGGASRQKQVAVAGEAARLAAIIAAWPRLE